MICVGCGMAAEPGDIFCAGCRSAHDNPDREPITEWPKSERQKRCPVCGGLNPGDQSHVRCM